MLFNADLAHFKEFVQSHVSMNDKTFDLASDLVNKEKIRKGDHFISQGTICSKIAFINKGLFKIYYLKNGLEVNTCFCSENEIASSFESFANNSSSKDTIQAIEDSEILVLSKAALSTLYKAAHEWQQFGSKMIEKECLRLTERVQSLGFESGLEKYKLLIEYQPHLIQRVPVQDIASYLGVSRETLSRIRAKINEI